MLDLLKGVRVLEFGILLNGDVLGMYLSDLGAEVLKVEEPTRGDYLRDMLGIITPHHSPAHMQVNKNKKSVAINVHTPEGKKAFFELLKTVDIFADGLRGGACEAMGVGYEVQKEIKPDIIYMANTGFGMTGPYKRLPAHGFSMVAVMGGLSGQKDENGFVDRVDNQTDVFGGVKGGGGAEYAVMAGLAALIRRDRTGQGAYIDCAASDAGLMSSWLAAVTNLNYDKITDLVGMSPRGEASSGWPAGSILYSLYESKDGKFMLFAAIEPKFWYNFCDAIGRDDIRDTMRKDTVTDYGLDRPWMRQVLADIFRERTADEWMEIALTKNVPICVANTLDQVPEDPHMKFRGVLVEREHPRAGPFTYVRYPAIVDGQQSDIVIPAPLLGEHTEEVLSAIGLSPEEIHAARQVPPRAPKN